MKAKFKYRTEAEIPAELKSHYTEQGGIWALDVEGAADKARLDEFRGNNVALAQEIQSLKAHFSGIDPAHHQALVEKEAERAEKELIQKGEFQAAMEQKTQAVRSELGARIKQTEAERDQLRSRLSEIQIDQAALAAATRRGLRATAVADLLNRARAAMRLQDGQAVVVTPEGETARTGAGGDAVTLEQWADQLQQEAPHLFESNFGSGAPNHSSGGTARNPFAPGKDWNLTEQMKLAKSNPQMAARLGAGSR